METDKDPRDKEKSNKNKVRRGQEHLSFYDYQKLMEHDCFKRVRGSIRRIR